MLEYCDKCNVNENVKIATMLMVFQNVIEQMWGALSGMVNNMKLIKAIN